MSRYSAKQAATLEILNDLRGAEAFCPMSELDWSVFAGADEGTLITYGDKFAFLLSPDGSLAVVGGDKEVKLIVEEVGG
jgi:hypothetical protein